MNFGNLHNFTSLTHSAVNVQIASTLVVNKNSDRVYLLLMNDSDTTMYLKVDAAANANQGIRLNANGGSHEISAALGNLHQGAYYATAATNGKNLLVSEG